MKQSLETLNIKASTSYNVSAAVQAAQAGEEHTIERIHWAKTYLTEGGFSVFIIFPVVAIYFLNMAL